ncbi:fucose isomerase, partial [bacterium]|nr:fucose isomerase [bacterium]
LTMQIFKHLVNTPVLFADVRHYFADHDILDLVNSGQHATYFAAKSFDFRENLAKVEFRPEGIYFPGGGASVFHLAAPGNVTLARLMRVSGRYWMAIVPGEFVQFDDATNEKLINQVQDNWPHAFFRLGVEAEEFFSSYSCNHIHGVYGDQVDKLIAVCHLLDIPYTLYT